MVIVPTTGVHQVFLFLRLRFALPELTSNERWKGMWCASNGAIWERGGIVLVVVVVGGGGGVCMCRGVDEGRDVDEGGGCCTGPWDSWGLVSWLILAGTLVIQYFYSRCADYCDRRGKRLVIACCGIPWGIIYIYVLARIHIMLVDVEPEGAVIILAR